MHHIDMYNLVTGTLTLNYIQTIIVEVLLLKLILFLEINDMLVNSVLRPHTHTKKETLFHGQMDLPSRVGRSVPSGHFLLNIHFSFWWQK